MTIFSCPNCNYPLLNAENLPVVVANLANSSVEPGAPIPAPDEPAPATSAPSIEEEELSVNRREYGSVMSRVEEWAGAEPWAGWEPSSDLFAGFKGWLRRAHDVDSLTITQNRFSGMLRELGSEWKKVGKGRLYSLPPQFRPEGMEPLRDPEDGPEIPTSAVVVPPAVREELPTPDAGFTGASPREGSEVMPALLPDVLAAAADPAPDLAGRMEENGIARLVAAVDAGVVSEDEAMEVSGFREVRRAAVGLPPEEVARPGVVQSGPLAGARVIPLSTSFPPHTADCALASTSGVAPCDCGVDQPAPVVGDEPEVEDVAAPLILQGEGEEVAGEVADRPLDDDEILAALAVVPAEGEPGRDAALVALAARRAAAAAAAAADPLAAPLVPAAAAADDVEVERAAEVSRQEFLRGGDAGSGPKGSWLHEDLGRPSTSSPFAPGSVEDYPAIED